MQKMKTELKHLFIMQKMKTEFMQTANLLTTELQLRVEGSNIYHCIAYQTFLTLK